MGRERECERKEREGTCGKLHLMYRICFYNNYINYKNSENNNNNNNNNCINGIHVHVDQTLFTTCL